MDFDNVDWNDPASLANLLGGRLPVPKMQSPADVRREARERSAKIHERFGFLSATVERHEPTIQKRWAKKTKQQRLKILLDAWPGMPATHRPDFDAFRKENEQERAAGTKYREHFMWPSINQEDLANPKNFLLLIKSRARNHPSVFAATDMASTHLGRVAGALMPIFLNQHVMVLNGATTAETYGELIAWEDHPDAFDWMHTRKQFLPGEGLMILEIQERLLTFLADCCCAILHDIPAETLTSTTFPVLQEPLLKTEAQVGGFESRLVMAEEAPYRLPARIDFGAIASLLEAKASAARDRVWVLREDPGYFAECVSETREHRQEMLKDTEGQPHPVFSGGREQIFWARIAGTLVVQAYMDLEVFSELHRQASHLDALHTKYASQISPANDLPEELLTAILRFVHYLDSSCRHPIFRLRTTVPASPPMREFFARQPPPNATTTQILTMKKPRVRFNRIESQLIWLLSTLWDDGGPLFLAGITNILDELERLIQAEPQAADRLSPKVMDHIGDLSIISQCLNQLNMYQPWAQGYDSARVGRIEGIEAEYEQWHNRIDTLVKGLRAENMGNPGKLVDISDKRFFYPIDKRRTKENVNLLRRAEHSLDEFWSSVDTVVYKQCGHLSGTAIRLALSEQRILQRTPEWVDAVAPKNQQPKEMQKNEPPRAVYKPLSTLYFNLPLAIAEPTKTASKTRIKTKGVPAPKPAPQQPEETVPIEPTHAPIRVGARALKVFRTLFHNPDVTTSPGEVSWQDFLYAMTSTGLFAAEKLYGSVWQFQRLDEESQSRILFHQPHPRGKLSFTMARRYGRRLTRAYGWVGELFVLDKGPGV
ncbi:hypothetical protein QBC34DRAFT_413215 [Podospora aff. communis PSN243]|uniref:Uncharacterized protein n=1 Tax=Podospora aff. communis PSN243 TaxID=3040156 RepID=A0AAV9GCP9_9PEZI|nr:hypothetical protein QBC34DRAFT_413215 [Podospora aff. communis PSN243]